ncbi:hypothetical protein Ddc_12815 [Ditylenchus destructor]|nr:hypothetical protein Ddc_12815 [Ditylenchus destructor]
MLPLQNSATGHPHQHTPLLSPETTSQSVLSRQLHLSSRLKPTLTQLHIISDAHIKFEYRYPPEKMEIRTFSGVELHMDQQNHSRTIKDFLTALPFCGYKCNSRHRSNQQQKLIISADDLLRNLPPWYVRFPTFDIRGIPDEVLLRFLRRAKRNFINCRLSLIDRVKEYADNENIQKVQELLTDIFLDASEILIHTEHGSASMFNGHEIFFNTCGVQKCNKVNMWNRRDRQAVESFKEWLNRKRDEPDSRRHLIVYRFAHSLKLVEDLKQAFKTATKPLHYMITFLECHVFRDALGIRSWDSSFEIPFDSDEFHLDNESTGERLSLFEHKGTNGCHRFAWRLWRRRVMPDDSIWLSALSDGGYTITSNFTTKQFYGFFCPNSAIGRPHQHTPSLSSETTSQSVLSRQLHLSSCLKPALTQHPPEKMKIQTFSVVALAVCIYRQNHSRTIEDFLTALPFYGYKFNSRYRSNKQKKLIISADDLLKNLPPWYVRFSTFEIRERLSLVEQKGTNGGERFAWRLWRRSVLQDDSIWLSALSDGGYTINGWEPPTPDVLIPEGFEKQFYGFWCPIISGDF